MRAYVRSLDPRISRQVWTLLSGSFANALGNGVVFPYLLIYLHNVRGISLGTAGLVLAMTSVAALVAGPASGAMIDHLGPRLVLCASMIVSAVGFGGFAFVHSTGPAFAAATLAGLGNGSFWPSHAGMVAALTERETRHNAYAMQRVLNNLGIAVGGFALAFAPHALWLGAAGLALGAGAAALVLERFLPEQLRRTPLRTVEAAA